jgi:Flp pilus assembly protein TadG
MLPSPASLLTRPSGRLAGPGPGRSERSACRGLGRETDATAARRPENTRRQEKRRAGRRRRRLGLGNDRGASAVELAILAPGLIFVSMLIVQFAIWLDGTHAALAAAQEGERTAAEMEFTNQATWGQSASQVALNYYHGLDTSVLAQVSVSKLTFDPAANTVSVTVSGQLSGIFPLTITETASGPVECFRTAQSQGTDCG